MSSSLPDELAQALALLRAKQWGEARALLTSIIQRHPRSDHAWFLLGLAVADPAQQRECFQRALQLNPQHSQAKERLQRLEEAGSQVGETRLTPRPPLLAAKNKGAGQERGSHNEARAGSTPAVDSETVVPHAPPAPALEKPVAAQRPLPRLKPTPKRAQALPGWLVWSVIGVGSVAAVVCAALAGLYAAGFLEREPAVVVVAGPTTMSFPTLPPTWTPSPVPTATPVPSATSTRTPTPTPSLPPPNATMSAAMDRIDQQVADLRGLAIVGEKARYLIARHRAEEVLRGLVLGPNLHAQLEDQKLVLTVLGLVKPTYDLVKYALNSHADNIGGFYLPWTGEMYVIGSEFGGIEHFIYSHEYTHALTDVHFSIGAMGVYPVCEGDGQRCSAIRALVEGDATLLMEQWWQQYATPQDYRDIADYEPPHLTVPEEFPPPYVVQDLAFPYDYGYEFVGYLHARGNWAAVNAAYTDLPQSTEHILHPEKYVASEAPLDVALPAQPALGEGWRLVDEDVLGEWLTYLILGYGADVAAQLPEDEAHDAAAGWGGDRFQVYHEAATGASVLVARWAWDSLHDGEEFSQALRAYHDQRFRGAQVDRADGACWEGNGQASCVYTAGDQTLWLLAPNQTVLNEVLLAFPDF